MAKQPKEPDIGGDIQVIDRAAQILRMITPQEPALRVQEVSNRLGLGRTTAVRYLTSLASTGFLERQDDGAYRLGPLQQQLGALALHSLRVLDMADPLLYQLAEDTGATAVLSVWGGTGPVIARSFEPPESVIAISVRVGATLGLESAQSLVFLAFMSDQLAAERLVRQLPTGPGSLAEQVAETRRQGFISNERVAQGLLATAAPVFDGHGRLTAAIALTGTVHSLSDDPASGQNRALMAVAEELSGSLGYLGEMPFADLHKNRKRA